MSGEKFASAMSCADSEQIEPYELQTQTKRALCDVTEGLRRWRVWLMLAYQDIKLRYRRSVLGPFWLTLSMAVTAYSMGFLYSHLFHTQIDEYFPFLVAGMLGWSLISTVVIEMIDGLISFDNFIKQIKLPYTLYAHRIAARNLLIFVHNLAVIVPIYLIFHKTVHVNFNTLLVIPGVAIIYFNAVTYGMVLAMIGARFRDVSQIIRSLIQVVFFVTPVMWSPQVLGEKYRYLVEFNPFYAFLQLVRAPLLGHFPALSTLLMVGSMSVFGTLISFSMFKKYRARIVYWL